MYFVHRSELSTKGDHEADPRHSLHLIHGVQHASGVARVSEADRQEFRILSDGSFGPAESPEIPEWQSDRPPKWARGAELVAGPTPEVVLAKEAPVLGLEWYSARRGPAPAAPDPFQEGSTRPISVLVLGPPGAGKASLARCFASNGKPPAKALGEEASVEEVFYDFYYVIDMISFRKCV